ncbi:MAG: putative transcriptional regulator [Deltaproteobacteria bacterium]|nr:putative transcriptional regulator [Deltaproteobacteria bacterium]
MSARLAFASEALVQPRHTILVVDDAPLMRELGALFLARAGRVITAANGEEAVAVAHLEAPDLIVADVCMPGIDGATLCRILKQDPLLGAPRVVLLAATGDADERERAVRAGADDVLPKPIDRVALLDSARRLLANAPRGLPRVPISVPIEIRLRHDAWDGLGRNLSRGGVFVESKRIVPPPVELALTMRLPESDALVASTAQVMWAREQPRGQLSGMGLRFLALDRSAARALSEWVEERMPHRRSQMEESA